MSTIKVDNISPGPNTHAIPVSDLRHQVIRSVRDSYRLGTWVPSTVFEWVPGTYYDYTPASSGSRIRYTISMSYGHVNGHAITHCIFVANGVERGRHSLSGQSPEHRHTYVWDFPSWGITSGRIGYRMRAYGTSNYGRLHGTYHWDGGGNVQTAQSEILIEEYFPII